MLLEEAGKDLTPEECEAAARPIDASDYWSEWYAYWVAQWLWADEVAEIDANCQDKTNKKALDNHTSVIWQWFKDLS